MTTTHVFVSFYVVLGDADSSIEGTRVCTRQKWEKNLKKFTDYLKENEIEFVEDESEFFGIYQVDVESWSVTPCTAKEAKVLTKFLGKTNGSFQWPSEVLESVLPSGSGIASYNPSEEEE